MMSKDRYPYPLRQVRFFRWLWHGLWNFWLIVVVGILINVLSTWLTSPEDFGGTPLAWIFDHPSVILPVCLVLLTLTVCARVLAYPRKQIAPQLKPLVTVQAIEVVQEEPATDTLIEKPTLRLPLWNLPYMRNPYFTGRDDFFQILERSFQRVDQERQQTHPAILAISGLGGIGKTQLASEYAYRYSQQYEAIFWFVADTRESLFSSYSEVLQIVQAAKIQEEDQKQIVQTVKAWLQTHSNWLLVFDNVHDTSLLKEFLPATGNGHILFTTRSHTLGRLAHMVHLDMLTEEQGILFLLRRSGYPAGEALTLASANEIAAARELCHEMGALPLALNQAAAYIEETRCGIERFLQLYRSQHIRLLRAKAETEYDYPESVMTTWQLSLEKVAARDTTAVNLLQVCSLLAPDAIPEELFLQGAAFLGAEFSHISNDSLAFEDAIKTTLAYSLLRRNTEVHTLSMHRLVQAVIRDGMGAVLLQQWRACLISALNTLFPRPGFAHWSICERLLPHALIAVNRPHAEREQSLEMAALLDKVAAYLYQRIRYDEVEALYQRSLQIKSQFLPSEDAEFAVSLHGLGILYSRQRRYEEAEDHYKQAITIRETALGVDHPEVVRSLNNLAMLYSRQKRYAEAEVLYVRVLQVREQTLGEAHEEVAYPLNGLANMYKEQGDLDKAEPLYLRALAIREQTLGPTHPEITYPLYGLSMVYAKQGRYAEAEKLHQRALEVSNATLGSDHPQTRMIDKGYAKLQHQLRKWQKDEQNTAD